MCGHAVGHTRICQMFVFAHQRGGRDFSNHISAVQPPIGCPKKRQVRICIKGWRAGLGTGEIAVGDLAALVAMGGTAPSRYALRHDQLLDGLVFAAKGTAVTDVWSAGRYVVKSGHIRYAIRPPIMPVAISRVVTPPFFQATSIRSLHRRTFIIYPISSATRLVLPVTLGFYFVPPNTIANLGHLMAKPKNILFIMFDQLRWDYLSCYGHPHLHTPNIDRLAAKGVRFNKAYIQSPLCGPSRMSTYTGRYVHSHGASSNNVPLKVGERTMGDYLRDAGMGCWLVGKTHMTADAEGMARLGLEPDSVIGARVSECGFDIFERDDGMRPEGPDGFYDDSRALKYNAYLRSKGYHSDNPWHDYANSANDADNNVLSGWFLKNSDLPANIAEEDSETPYLTRRGMDFITAQGDAPWCCHLSYIKPHWPYIVPAPYHDMFGPEHFLPVVRSEAEREDPHPVYGGMMKAPVCTAFSRDDVRDKVLRAYMGLIKQCDDQMGVLFDWLEETGRMKDTMIVVTSDHGDYLGDHWLGEKTFFHDAAIKVPLIVYDPSPEADKTRGTTSYALVQSIDLVPTFTDVAGVDPSKLDHVLEGKSLLPLLHGKAETVARNYVFCEFDYSMRPLAHALDLDTTEARIFMVSDDRWKLIQFGGGFRSMLFDLAKDPQELTDLGDSAAHQEVISQLTAVLDDWARRPSQRTTMTTDTLMASRHKASTKGVLLGAVDEGDMPAELSVKYRGKKVPKWQDR